jgi:hypothetical protein
MNINDLKVGDKVKYYFPEWMCLDKTIGEGEITYNYHNNTFTINDVIVIGKNLIISKLELIPTQYKEIPIEHYKPYDFKLLSCCLCCKKEWGYEYSRRYHCNTCLKLSNEFLNTPILTTYSGLPIKETTYHCPKCDKKISGTCGIAGKQYAKEPCKECLNKQNPAPKSFKFDINITSINISQRYGSKPNVTVSGHGQTMNNNYFEFEGLDFPSDFDHTKTYTLEIKEKL